MLLNRNLYWVFDLEDKMMKFLSNIYDHRLPNAQMYHCYSFNAMMSHGQTAMDADWQHHLDWINENIIGPPKATKKYTQKQLEDIDMIGIYKGVK